MLGGLREASLAVADDVPDISPGLRWLADRFDTLEGHTVDQEERDVDNCPRTGLQFALGDIALGTARSIEPISAHCWQGLADFPITESPGSRSPHRQPETPNGST